MNRRTTLAKTTAGIAVGTLALALTGCGGSHTNPARPADAAGPATTSPSTAVPPSLTGPALRAVLPTAADLAKGVNVSGDYDTGTSFTAPTDLPAPALPGADCTAAPAIDADVLTGDYRAAYASEEIDNTGNSLQLVAAATNPGDAAKLLAEIRDFAKRCASFTAPDSAGSSVGGTVELDSFAGIGDEAIRIRVTAAGPNAAKYSQPEVILVRVGDKIAAVSDADQAHDEAAAVVVAKFLAGRLAGQPL